MATKFYLRNTAATGTTPTAEQSTALPVGTANSQAFQRGVLSVTKGTSQTTNNQITLAQVAQQSGLPSVMSCFISAPLAAQTIPAATWTFAFAAAEGSTSANAFMACAVYVWRPGTGAKVGTIYDAATLLGTEWATSETGRVVTFSGASLAIQDGDVIILEAWYVATQSMATAYALNWSFDGTTDPTDGSATSDAASYLSTPDTLTFSGGTFPLTAAPVRA